MDGTPFGRYRLIELLGRGGMGEVWRAFDTETKRIVAIKVLPAHLADDSEFVQRFRREAESAAQLNSPHVVPIHNYGEIDGRLYVDMRLIEGRDLQSVLTAGPLEPARAVRIIEGAALALHAAHQVGLLHRDVKPSNILLDRDDFAYLIDFGIARAIDGTRMTKSGNTIGTFHYIAPERLGTRDEEDARADIYSLACVLYECLAGSPPFPGDTMAHLVAAHLSTPPPRPSVNQPDVPAQVDEVIATGMAKDPDQRYATTIELSDAAHDAITVPIPRQTPSALLAATQQARTRSTAEPTLAATERGGPPASTPQPADRSLAEAVSTVWWRQRQPVLIVAILAAVVLLAAGFIVFRPQQPSQPPVLVPAPPAPSAAPNTQPAPPPAPKPVEQAALQGLLLTPEQINTVLGTTGMTVNENDAPMGDDSARLPGLACQAIEGTMMAPVYAGSGWTTFHEQVLGEPRDWDWVDQSVALFASVPAAGEFFTASAQLWPGCANRQYKIGTEVWAAGPVSNANGMLSDTQTLQNSPTSRHRFCQRALTVANNVVIDVGVCTHNLPDLPSDAAVNIAKQVAAKVATT